MTIERYKMNKIMSILKKIIPNSIKAYMLEFYMKPKYRKRMKQLLDIRNSTKSKVVFLIGTQEYGNLGDHAITIAEIKLINNTSDNIKVLEITAGHFRFDYNRVIELVRKDDIITITGGGFIGDLWMIEEEMIRSILSFFPNNKIIIFPQTIFFQDNKELELTRKIYQNHKHLFVCLRERTSYDFCKNNLLGGEFKNCYLVPDIVMYLNEIKNNNRNGILLCLRKDREAILTPNDKEMIKETAYKKNQTISFTDTVLEKWQNIKTRNHAVSEKLNEFGSAELVITDRLHGMLFSVITGTPCIALNNLSGKVKGTYDEWLTQIEYIKYADNPNEINEYIIELMKIKKYNFDNNDIIKKYDILTELLKK